MAQTTPATPRSDAEVDVRSPRRPLRDMVRWGPVFAGLTVLIATMTLLTLLGVAIGLTAEPVIGGEGELGVAATIWGILTAVVAFLVGGFVAAYSTPMDTRGGTFNGFMVGALAIAALTVAAGLGIGNLLGAGAANLGEIADIAPSFETDDAVQVAQGRIDDARVAAWATIGAFAAAVVLAALGGLAGSKAGPHADPDDRDAR